MRYGYCTGKLSSVKQRTIEVLSSDLFNVAKGNTIHFQRVFTLSAVTLIIIAGLPINLSHAAEPKMPLMG